MIPRFHIPFPLAPGAQIDLPETISHHALRVLRMQAGDPLVLFDGNGGEWHAELGGKTGSVVRASLKEFVDRDCESPLAITLVQAIPAGDKMDWVVEKCVELGVTAIQPVTAKRSVIRLSAERMERRVMHWNHIASAACAQSGRNRVPTVAPVLDLPQYLAVAKTLDAQRLILAPQAEQPLRTLEKPLAPLIVMVGPEGGWDDSELQAARTAGFIALQLGRRVLRTETAGAAAIAALQAIWGDF